MRLTLVGHFGNYLASETAVWEDGGTGVLTHVGTGETATLDTSTPVGVYTIKVTVDNADLDTSNPSTR